MSDATTRSLSEGIIEALAEQIPSLPDAVRLAINEHIDAFASVAQPGLLADVSAGTLFDDIVRFLAGKGVDTAGWNDYRSAAIPAMHRVKVILLARLTDGQDIDGWRPMLMDEDIPVGTEVRIIHPCRTFSGGSVYFDASVTEGKVIDYYRSTRNEDVRVQRTNGNDAISDQSIGRQYLYVKATEVVPGTTDAAFPEAPVQFRSYHLDGVGRIREWAADGTPDVKAGVDEQMRFFGDKGWWPTDSCGTEGEAKDWCSAVMKWKCDVLGIDFPVVDTEEPEPVVEPERTYTKAEYDRVEREAARLRTWQSQAIDDMTTASETLMSEANRRNWCSEYDEIVTGINSRLNVLAFDEREREVEVTITGYVRVPFSYSITVETTSTDDSDIRSEAIDQWNNNYGASTALDYIDRYDAEIEDDTLEAEIQ